MPGPVNQLKAAVRENNVLAVVALVLSVLGVVTLVCAPIGAILGHIAKRQIRRNGQTNRGMATGAIALGWSVVSVYLLIFVLPALLLVGRGMALFGLLSD